MVVQLDYSAVDNCLFLLFYFCRSVKLELQAWRRLSQTVVGLILTNSYIQVIWIKIPYDGVLKWACVSFLNCHACPFVVFSCPIGMLQSFMALHRFPFFFAGIFHHGWIGGRAGCLWLALSFWFDSGLDVQN